MSQSMRRNKTVESKKDPTKFYMQLYLQANNPQQYLQNLLKNICSSKSINTEKININQLSQIIKHLSITLKDKQLHQLYLFGTYQPGKSTNINQKRAISIISMSNNKINLRVVSQWIQKRIQKNKLLLDTGIPKTTRVRTMPSQSEHGLNNHKKYVKLPLLINKQTQRFKTEIKKVLGIFSQMEKERQNAGLEPVALSSDQEQMHESPTKQIHYEGQFFDVNQKLFNLRSEAQKGIEQIIQVAKYDKKLKQKFEQALLRYEKVRMEANEKMGKCGSMKAQKRMINKSKEQIRKLDKWRADTCQTEFSSKYF